MTLAGAFAQAVALRGQRIALREKKVGLWRATSWAQYGERVRDTALGLQSLGFARGDRVAILGTNCSEWMVADFAVLTAGGVSVGIYPTDSPRQVEYVVADSGARWLFVEDEEQLDKALAVRERLPALQRIVVFDMEGLRRFADPMVTSLEALMQAGRERALVQPGQWHASIAAVSPDDLAILIYTSGTTGAPKGAMLTHRGLVFQAGCLASRMPEGPDDEQLSYLPLCHIAERLTTVFRPVFHAATVHFVESADTMAHNVREVSPTVFFGVPRVWEKFYSAIRIAADDASALERRVFDWALRVGARVAECRLAGCALPAPLALAHAAAERLALRRARKLIGMDRARYVITGAAPIAPELIRWYLALGLDMREAYGMTETAGVATLPPPGRRKLGSVGTALPGTEVRIGDAGEILVRGEHVFAGYVGLPGKTREAIDEDGWLHTGDVGSLDDEGFLRITDRLKDIFITAGGKNVTPSEIENQLKFSPYIADAVVIGDRRKYLSALVMIDPDNVAKYAQDARVPFTNYASLCRAREVIELIQREIDRVNAQFARVEGIKRFRLIEVQLSAEDEELTPTMKLKRKLVNEKYKSLIDSMYPQDEP
ncbi:MAG: long-chain fatty acid--CoA ligase [Nitrospira sp.]|nr:long-chain fatty acid--CoA ligase [Nitrospira sp.]